MMMIAAMTRSVAIIVVVTHAWMPFLSPSLHHHETAQTIWRKYATFMTVLIGVKDQNSAAKTPVAVESVWMACSLHTLAQQLLTL